MSFNSPVTGSPKQFNGQTLDTPAGVLLTGSLDNLNTTYSFSISSSVPAILDVEIDFEVVRAGASMFLDFQPGNMSGESVHTFLSNSVGGNSGFFTASYYLGHPTYNNSFTIEEVNTAAVTEYIDFTASFTLREVVNVNNRNQKVVQYGNAAGNVTEGTIHADVGDGRLWTPTELGSTYYSLWLDPEVDTISFDTVTETDFESSPRFTSDDGDADYNEGKITGVDSSVGVYFVNGRTAYNIGPVDEGGPALGYFYNKRIYDGAENPTEPSSTPKADEARQIFVVYDHFERLNEGTNRSGDEIFAYGIPSNHEEAFNLQVNQMLDTDTDGTNYLGFFTGTSETLTDPLNGSGSVMSTSTFTSSHYYNVQAYGMPIGGLTDTVMVESTYDNSSNTLTMRKNGTQIISQGGGSLNTTYQNNSDVGFSLNLDSKDAIVGSKNTNFKHGNIAEVIIFKTLLSEEERQRVEGYLAWKWGTVSSLDSSHPYKTAPPIIEWSNDESAEPFPDGTSDFVIRTYQNMTSLYRRNVQQVPFSRASKGPISLRQRISAYSSSLG